MPETEVIAWLESEIRKAIDDGFVTFISGMARGVDIWAAEIVLRLRDEGADPPYLCQSVRGIREKLVGRLEAAIQRHFAEGRYCEVHLSEV